MKWILENKQEALNRESKIMIFPWSDDKTKSQHFEAKGDSLHARQNFRKAYTFYKKAAYFDENREPLFKKLLTVMDHFKEDWSEEDFVENVYWAMRQQELIDPTFKRIHFRAEPVFNDVTNLIQAMLKANTPESETQAVEDIVKMGEDALYPLIEYILTFKKMSYKAKKESQEQTNKTPSEK